MQSGDSLCAVESRGGKNLKNLSKLSMHPTRQCDLLLGAAFFVGANWFGLMKRTVTSERLRQCSFERLSHSFLALAPLQGFG